MKLPFFLAKRFVAGESFTQSLPAIQELTKKGLLVTLDLLGEYVTDREVAVKAKDSYIREKGNRKNKVKNTKIISYYVEIKINKQY